MKSNLTENKQSASSAVHTILSVPIGDIRPHPDNPRRHSKRQIRQVADSIKRFGFRFPVLVDAQHRLVAGHCRIEAAKLLGLNEVPVIEAADLSDAEVRALMIADNIRETEKSLCLRKTNKKPDESGFLEDLSTHYELVL